MVNHRPLCVHSYWHEQYKSRLRHYTLLYQNHDWPRLVYLLHTERTPFARPNSKSNESISMYLYLYLYLYKHLNRHLHLYLYQYLHLYMLSWTTRTGNSQKSPTAGPRSKFVTTLYFVHQVRHLLLTRQECLLFTFLARSLCSLRSN